MNHPDTYTGKLTDRSQCGVCLEASCCVRLVRRAKRAIETVSVGHDEEAKEDKVSIDE